MEEVIPILEPATAPGAANGASVWLDGRLVGHAGARSAGISRGTHVATTAGQPSPSIAGAARQEISDIAPGRTVAVTDGETSGSRSNQASGTENAL